MRHRPGLGAKPVTVTLSRHIFGTVRGYQTLAASTDVTDEEQRLLESFSFGQTNSRAYLDSLSTDPSYWSRPLPSGRRAITRVLRGAPDDQGRATLLFVTVLLSNDAWVNSLACDDTQLLTTNRLWEWDRSADLAPLRVAVGDIASPVFNAHEKDKILSLLEAVERESEHPNTTIVGADSTLQARDVSLLVALLPHDYKPHFSYAVRSLSDGLPVHVNGLAECASRGKSRRKVVRWSPKMKSDPRQYTAALSYFWNAGADPPWTFVANCKSFGQIPFDLRIPSSVVEGADPSVAGPLTDAPPARRATGKGVSLYAVLAVVLVLLMAATTLYVQRTIVAKGGRESRLAEARNFLKDNPLPDSLTPDANQRADLMAEATNLAKGLTIYDENSADQELNTLRDKFAEWHAIAKVRGDAHQNFDDWFDGFRAFRDELGLNSPRAITEDPTVEKLDALQERRKWLKDHEALADQLGEPYPGDIMRALNEIADWEHRLDSFREKRAQELVDLKEKHDQELADLKEKRDQALAELTEKCAELYDELSQLQKILAGSPPTKLDADSLKDWENCRDRLEASHRELKRLDSLEIGVCDDKTQRRLGSCERLEKIREREIGALKDTFEATLQDARKIIDDSDLRFDPLGTPLTGPWREAQRALQRLAKSLEIWPRNDHARNEQAVVNVWLMKAARSAFKHFENDVNSVEQDWLEWKANDGSDLTVPKRLLDELNVYLEYWDKNRHIIEYDDPPGADELQSRARKLKIELDEAGNF